MALAALPAVPQAAGSRSTPAFGGKSFLDNGAIRVGVDLDEGGTITYLSRVGGASLVNDHDLGRQVQQSYYDGPQPFGHPTLPGFSDWPWNANPAGDGYGHPSPVLDFSNDGTTIYVKSEPLQWALASVSCECTLEQWISLEGNAVHVRNRLSLHRSDRALYPGYGQELPAMYTIGPLNRLFSYRGVAPFSGAPAEQIPLGTPAEQTHFYATEHWSALVDASGFGLGVFNPAATESYGFFAGRECGSCGPHDDSTGYVSAHGFAVLDHADVYENSYDLILGTVDQIRAYAVAHRPQNEQPDYHFDQDRRGWAYVNAHELRYPIEGALRVDLADSDPQLVGPEQAWAAPEVPTLYIHAALHSHQNQADLFYRRVGEHFNADNRIRFTLIPDGRYHTYAVDLRSSPGYRGTIGQVRFDPIDGEAGAFIDVAWISWKTVSHPRTISLRLGDHVQATGRVAVSDGYRACAGRIAAIVQRLRGGTWTPVGSTRTNAAGAFSVRLPDRGGAYRAIAPAATRGNEICLRATSAARRH